MPGSLRLRHRILLGYLIPILLMVGASLVVYGSLGRLTRTETGANHTWRDVNTFEEMAYYLATTQRAARGYLLGGGQAELNAHNDAVAATERLSRTLYQTLRDPRLRAILGELQSLSADLNQRDDRLFLMVQAGQADAAIRAWKQSAAQEFGRRIDGLINQAQQRGAALLLERTQEATAARQGLVTAVITGTASAAVIAVLLALWIAQGISRRVEEATRTIATSTSEISATVTQQERTTLAQSGSVSEVTTTIEQLSQSAQSVAEQAEAASNSSREVLRLAEEGSTAVAASTERVTGVRERTEAIANQARQLGELTGQISGITVLVREMAAQTNVLAINAAVEATRAGEQGRGFKVVASEIRQLANDSKQSVERIGGLVKEVQKATNTTVAAVDEGTHLILENLELARQTAHAFERVTDAMTQAFDNVQQIALNVKQQASALREVGSAMISIDAGAKDTAQGTGQTKVGLQRLHEAASELRDMV